MPEVHMLTRFKTKTTRVKGLSFHPTRPWILCSLHSGVIQLWDYRSEVLVASFEEHEGPVRAVDFHLTQPLFVSGGDDYKVKVWNYKQRRCLFTFYGHVDYVRTAKFHHEYPWILTASDDQTFRIWNWQSRTLVAVVSGHHHYVMCAQFHPTEDLIVTASLDCTVRVWDISRLRRKQMAHGPTATPDGLAVPDVSVKHVLERHTRGVNWAAFHPTSNLIVSGADDRQVKVWRMGHATAWEVDNYHSHTNNVSCVMFHPRYPNIIISNSEDRTLKLWETDSHGIPPSFRRENDRYWILASHPTQNLIAAGHDSGLSVFKLQRERPAFAAGPVGRFVLYYSARYIRRYTTKEAHDVPVYSLANSNSFGPFSLSGKREPRDMHLNPHNPSECNVILTEQKGGDKFELYSFAKDATTTSTAAPTSVLSGSGLSVAFLSRNRIAVLSSAARGEISMYNLQLQLKRTVTLPIRALQIFQATAGQLLLRCSDKIALWDSQSQKIVAELPLQVRYPIKYVIWGGPGGFSRVAMISKTTLVLADGKLSRSEKIAEPAKLKSGVWDASGAFLYSTITHIKYALFSGETGLIRALDNPVYITASRGQTIFALDRSGSMQKFDVENSEYLFKIAVERKQFRTVEKILRAHPIQGEALIAYLQRKGLQEVALRFVTDPETRLSLALECGRIDTAGECAKAIDKPEAWARLASEALRQGNHQVVEHAYQKMRNLSGLSFLYLITGNIDTLSRMMAIAHKRQDRMDRFQNALFLGDKEEMVQVLSETGQLSLALLAAHAHGLGEAEAQLRDAMGDKAPVLPDCSGAQLFVPPIPILPNESAWPLLEIEDPHAVAADAIDAEPEGFDADEPAGTSGATPFDDSDGEGGVGNGGMDAFGLADDLGDAAGGLDDGFGDLDLGVDGGLGDDDPLAGFGDDESGAAAASTSDWILASVGKTFRDVWLDKPAQLSPGGLFAAGKVGWGLDQLRAKIGAIHFEPLKPYYLQLHRSAAARFPMGGALGSIPLPLQADTPDLALSLEDCRNALREGYTKFGRKNYAEAKAAFRKVLYILVFLHVDPSDAADLIRRARNYLVAVALTQRAAEEEEVATNPKRALELLCYVTKLELEEVHMINLFTDPIKRAFSANNFNLTASLARRLLEHLTSWAEPPSQTASKAQRIARARKILQRCEQTRSNAFEIAFDARETLELDVTALVRVESAVGELVRCPFCVATHHKKHTKKLCGICNIAAIGVVAPGLA